MDERLIRLIQDFQSCVAEAVAMLEAAGFARPASNVEWSLDRRQPQVGALTGGFTYRKHGYGCAVEGPGWSVDFDFGAGGEIDGFDAWRLGEFAEGRLERYGFTSTREVRDTLERAASQGGIVGSESNLYYLAASAS